MFKSLAFCFVLITITAVRSNTVEWWSNSKSVQLDADNFNSFIGKNKHVMVNFYSKYSADSQTMAPEWDRLAEQYMGPDSIRDDVIVAMIDGWAYEKISDLYGVSMLPQILLFLKGQHTPQRYFEDNKDSKRYSEWMEALIATVKEGGSYESVPEYTIPQSAPVVEATDAVETSQVDETVVVDEQADNVVEDVIVDVNDQPMYDDEPSYAADVAIEYPEEVASPVLSEEPVAEVVAEGSNDEVKVDLNSDILQSQLEGMQNAASNIQTAVGSTVTDTVSQIEELKNIIASQKEEMESLYATIKENSEVLEEVKEKFFLGSQEGNLAQNSVIITPRNLEEAKITVEGVFEEAAAELKKGTSTSRALLFLIGTLGGAVLTYVGASLVGKKNKRRSLYD